MLTAYLRAHEGGALLDTFDIRRPESSETALAHLGEHGGPSIWLCSDYLWSLEPNLATARQALATTDRILFVHGGPSAPKYEADARRFLRENQSVAQVLVRGEGEIALAEILATIRRSGPAFTVDDLREVDGITYISPLTGAVVRTNDRKRLATLDALPSPIITGEFDDAALAAWLPAFIETSRGCPYRCSFCDWGSATMSRVRRFEVDRVAAEIELLARAGTQVLGITDANFGMYRRDIEIAQMIAAAHRRHGTLGSINFTPTKTSPKYLNEIFDIFEQHGISTIAQLGVQSFDQTTLTTVDRENIPTAVFLELARTMRCKGLQVSCDLLVGLPGQTVESHVNDVQFMLDHELNHRTWNTVLLPNSPMNDPGYRERFAITVDGANRVLSSTTFSAEERAEMAQFSRLDAIANHFGVFRQVLRYLQWDHGLPATSVLRALQRRINSEEAPLPAVRQLVSDFEHEVATGPNWDAVYEEFSEFVAQLVPEADPLLPEVVALQAFLMPANGRSFPDSTVLPHDFSAYSKGARRHAFDPVAHPRPSRLAQFDSAAFTIAGDPLRLCRSGLRLDDGRAQSVGDVGLWTYHSYELDSPLASRSAPFVARRPREERLMHDGVLNP
jgi:hypothetical protein